MKLVIERPVIVITPSIGKSTLYDAISSVKNQTYSNIKHLVVLDGPNIKVDIPNDVNVVQLPQNTGGGGYYGHRIYSAFPFLVNEDYVCFLDEDNWYKPDHIESLVKTHEDSSYSLDFSYSLRSIFSENGEYLLDDDCESLGQWPIWMTHSNPQYMIDTSSFMFKRDFIAKTCHNWFWGWGGDRHYFNSVKNEATFESSYKYSLAYRLSGNDNSVSKEFFIQGNEVQHKVYNEGLPWK